MLFKVIYKREIEKNDLYEIVNLKRDHISPDLYSKLLQAQSTSVSVERSFSMLKKLLRDDRNFLPENIEHYIVLYYNSSIKRDVE